MVTPYHKPPIRAQRSLVHGTAITQVQLSQKGVQNYNLVIKLLSAEIRKVKEVSCKEKFTKHLTKQISAIMATSVSLKSKLNRNYDRGVHIVHE